MSEDFENTRWHFIYRKGYWKALVDIYALFDSREGLKAKDTLPIIRAAINKPDMLMVYSGNCVIRCTAWDKKKNPTEYELMEAGWGMTKEQREDLQAYKASLKKEDKKC